MSGWVRHAIKGMSWIQGTHNEQIQGTGGAVGLGKLNPLLLLPLSGGEGRGGQRKLVL